MGGVRPGSMLAREIERAENIARWMRQLDTLVTNLAIAAALCRAFHDGYDAGQRPAPGEGREG